MATATEAPQTLTPPRTEWAAPEVETPLPVAEPVGKFQPWPLTVELYLELYKVGILKEKDRILLWNGQIVEKMTKNNPHVATLADLMKALIRFEPAIGCVVQEGPIRLCHRDDTLPEPDIAVVRGSIRDYPDTPTSRDVSLVVEVADSSLAADRREVMTLYAAESIPVYWIANIPERQVEVYTEPSGPTETPIGYRRTAVYKPGASVPVVIDGAEVGQIPVSAIFP